MKNSLSPANLFARSVAFALAQRNPRLSSFRQRRGAVMSAVRPASLLLAAAALLVLLATDIISAPTADAQDATITSLLSGWMSGLCPTTRLRMRVMTRPIPREA